MLLLGLVPVVKWCLAALSRYGEHRCALWRCILVLDAPYHVMKKRSVYLEVWLWLGFSEVPV